MKNPILLLTLFIFTQSSLSAQTQETILNARIWLDGKSMLDLQKADLEIDHGFFEPGVSFRADFTASELSRIKAAGFRIDTFEADVVAKYLQENAKRKPVRTAASARNGSPCDDYGSSNATPSNYTYGSMGGFYTYEEFLAILDDMRAKFPNLISARQVVSPTLVTHEGRPQWFVKISDHPDVDEAEPEALYTAVHHAREPNSLTHLIYFMWHLLENYGRDPELRYLVDHTELYFIPCLNPDGYIYNQTTNPDGGGYWRKNRRDNGDGTFGVDLNRNYGYNWGDGFGGSSSDPYSDTYHGPDPFSEPETQMAKAFIEAHDFEIALNCHTSGNKLVHPWGYENSVPTPDFTTLSNWFTRESNYFAGSCWQTLGYLSNGTSDDWMYGEKGKFAFTPETGGSFWPPIDQIDGNNKGMLLTNLSAAWYTLGGAMIRHQPGVSFGGNTLQVPFKIMQYELGTAPILVSFQAISSNILGFSAVPPLSLNDFETNSFSCTVSLSNTIQAGEEVRFVAYSERLGQIHTDTVEIIYNDAPFTTLFADNSEASNTQWVSGEWGQTTEQSYSPTQSMTDSPYNIYTSEENTLSTVAPLLIPNNALDARLRFFTRWDIEPELDWAQVLVSADGGSIFSPLTGTLTHQSAALNEPVYEGDHSYWEEECIDLNPYIGQPFFLRFAMTAYSGNPNGRDGFYFDDLLLEYKTASGVFTLNIPDAWKLESRPNPAHDLTWVRWEKPIAGQQNLHLEICSPDGKIFKKMLLEGNPSNAVQLETGNWPAGLYFYRLSHLTGNSEWKKLVVAH